MKTFALSTDQEFILEYNITAQREPGTKLHHDIKWHDPHNYIAHMENRVTAIHAFQESHDGTFIKFKFSRKDILQLAKEIQALEQEQLEPAFVEP